MAISNVYFVRLIRVNLASRTRRPIRSRNRGSRLMTETPIAVVVPGGSYNFV